MIRIIKIIVKIITKILNCIGAVVGSNFVGALLDGKCNAIFITNSSLLLGKIVR